MTVSATPNDLSAQIARLYDAGRLQIWRLLAFLIAFVAGLALSAFAIEKLDLVDLFAIVCWPVIVIGVGGLVASYQATKRGYPWPSLLKWLIVAGFFAALFAAWLLLILGNDTVSLLLDQSIFKIAFGIGIFCLVFFRSTKLGKITSIFTCVLAVASVGMGGVSLVGDYLLPRKHAVGIVQQVYRPSSRFEGKVYISGRRFGITEDIYKMIVVGQPVRIEYGAGSGSVFRLDGLVPTSH